MRYGRHDHFEELISASLGGELTDAERTELDAHLDTCDACRATLAAFADQRRIVSGLRHVGAPRDLGARVRAGIEGGAFAAVPWWRRPAVLFAGVGGGLAAVAGALLALVVLNAVPDEQVGDATARPTPSVSVAATQSPPPIETAPPSATPAATTTPTPEATPEPPVELPAEPDVYLAYTGPFDNLVLTLRDGVSGETLHELPVQGPPVAAELSPNGQFLAFTTRRGQSGLHDVWVIHLPSGTVSSGAVPPIETDLAEWETVDLGESMAGSELLEHMAWSPNSRWLAFTRADVDGAGTDAWLFDASTGATQQLTTDGVGYAASWIPVASEPSQLWISVAGDEPTSELVVVDESNPAECCGTTIGTLPVFQPLISPTGSHVIYWRGVMAQQGAEWAFVEGGAPYIADVQVVAGATELVNERPLFSDVTIDRDAFVSAGIEWGADGDAYAVWRVEWAGIPQGSQGEYPAANRVYFGHAGDERELTEDHAIDAADIPEDASVVDVKVTTTRHLLVTASEPVGGVMDAPVARLLLVTRNTGNVADEVAQIRADVEGGWFGPPAYDADPRSGRD